MLNATQPVYVKISQRRTALVQVPKLPGLVFPQTAESYRGSNFKKEGKVKRGK